MRKCADDITILCKGIISFIISNINSTQEAMQTALNQLHEWSLRSGFKFSATKIKCILFTKQKKETTPFLKLGNQTLSKISKYLEIF